MTRLLSWLVALFVLTAHAATFAATATTASHHQSRHSAKLPTYDQHGQAQGNCTRYVDPLGQTQRMTWDDHWQLLKLTRADGSSFSFVYDSLGNLIKATDPSGQIARLSWHERLQKLRSTTAVDGTRWFYTYDERGNCTEVQGPNHLDTDGQTKPYREATVYDHRGLTGLVDMPVVVPGSDSCCKRWNHQGLDLQACTACDSPLQMQHSPGRQLATGRRRIGL